MNVNVLEKSFDTQVVGAEYKAGVETDAEIAEALKLTEIPEYHANTGAATDALCAAQKVAYVLPTLDDRFVCVFDHDGLMAVTVSQLTPAAAAACALYFLACKDKSLVT